MATNELVFHWSCYAAVSQPPYAAVPAALLRPVPRQLPRPVARTGWQPGHLAQQHLPRVLAARATKLVMGAPGQVIFRSDAVAAR